jgi:hypothetical protein
MPADTPVTIPPPVTVAAGLVALHAPPGVALNREIAELTQTVEEPEIALTDGRAFMVISFVAVAVPHDVVTVYVIVQVPGETPLTTPPDTVALAFDALHVPPGTLAVRVIVVPAHTEEGPDILPADARGLTVTTAV